MNPFHTHEFTAAELANLVAHNGLRVTSVRGVVAGSRLVALDDKYRSFVDAQLASPPEAWSVGLAANVASVSVADFGITDVADDDCLDLILLARRP